MRTYISAKDYSEDYLLREHPWTHSLDNPDEQYIDFNAHPELIEESLGSFKPWAGYEGVRQFYELIKWLNGPESRLETNDCRFEGVEVNLYKGEQPKQFVCRGSLMFFYRSLHYNVSPESEEWVISRLTSDQAKPLSPGEQIAWLRDTCHYYLDQLNPDFKWGALEISLFTTKYKTLPLPEAAKFGHEVVFKFWAWGDDDEETMANFQELVSTLWDGFKLISGEITQLGG